MASERGKAPLPLRPVRQCTILQNRKRTYVEMADHEQVRRLPRIPCRHMGVHSTFETCGIQNQRPRILVHCPSTSGMKMIGKSDLSIRIDAQATIPSY
jgi:hypothetical protein